MKHVLCSLSVPLSRKILLMTKIKKILKSPTRETWFLTVKLPFNGKIVH